ncbi:type IV pilus assembly protein FimV [Tepidicella baoligensis]|uniref:type IV pilus assembly protein FimV n=1 Tax=Tepidicella baoligensis TaxID=2707016 RepID=UPI0015DB7FC1|nr:hypothetical protein [Tepidicella baoligensis]
MLKLGMGSVLLATTTQVVAVSLGATQGNVIIGRPLDILIQSSIDASEAAAGLCLEAEVIYGDMRVAATAITAEIHRVGTGGAGALRVRATEPVNEPIVTVTIQVGCQTPFRRSYTLLADVEPRLATPAPAASGPVLVQRPPAPAAAPVEGLAPVRVAGQPSTAAATPARSADSAALQPETPIRLSAPAPRPAAVTRMLSKTRPLPVVAPPPVQDDPRHAAGTVTLPQDEPAAGSRLQLDPVDMPSAGAASDSGSAPMTSDAPVPTVAAVEPNPLQQELEALRAEQERLRLALETMNAQLRAAEQAQQGSSALVYGLGGLSLLLLAGLWYAWRTWRRSAASAPVAVPWWESSLPQPAQTAPAGPPGEVSPPDGMDGLEVADARESMFHEVPVAPLDLAALEDTWQQARFCESIGQFQEAMAALSAFVSDSPRASEAPYLLWLQLAQLHGSENDRSAAQRFYETHFQRLVPERAQFSASRHLDEDTAFIQALVREWPRAAAGDLLARALASQPGAADSPLTVRTLAAFDDLLMLRGVWELREACSDTPQQETALPVTDWKSVTELSPRPGGAAAAAPMLDFELPSAPPLSGADESSGSPTSEKREDHTLDFDVGSFELEPPIQTKPDDPKT